MSQTAEQHTTAIDPHKLYWTPEEREAQRIYKPWISHLFVEMRDFAQYEYGDFDTLFPYQQAAEQERWLNSPARAALLASGCNACHLYGKSGQMLFPPHTPPTEGHEPHCTCERCW